MRSVDSSSVLRLMFPPSVREEEVGLGLRMEKGEEEPWRAAGPLSHSPPSGSAEGRAVCGSVVGGCSYSESLLCVALSCTLLSVGCSCEIESRGNVWLLKSLPKAPETHAAV